MVSSNSYGNHQQEPNNNNQKHFLSVHKPPSKPAKKPPTSAPGSNQPRVYNVKPIHFRELVQRLTGSASQPQAVSAPPPPPPQRLQSAAPPPIQLNSWAAYNNNNNNNNNNSMNVQKNDHSSNSVGAMAPQDPTAGKFQKKSTAGDGFMIGDLGMELSLSPTSCSWFSFPLLSPGPLSNYGA